MTFKLHLPHRLEVEPPPVANPANPLIEGQPVAANDAAAADRISGLAELADGATREAADDANHEAKVERSAIISADGVPYWQADELAGLPAWTDAEIKRAITQGVGRDGRRMQEPMAFGWYAGIRDEDLDAIVAYLRTLPPVAR